MDAQLPNFPEWRHLRRKLAVFDTVLTFPGARFPWEALVAACKQLGIMSFINGAHSLGYVDLAHLGDARPDFMVSNCWKYPPRGCTVLYVPLRNQQLISSTLPTSWGYETREERAKMEPHEYISRLFDKVSTTDNTPYYCIPLALEFRSEVCGGEAKIPRQGGARMAELLGTGVLGSSSSSFRQCCFTNVRLPLTFSELAIDTSC
ncbi:hypothetical protein B0T25DRAFT_442344 [Lasiosphaeria hispida]|uniref:Aminotransferase class V domain-containing protein n=1 Tax=Lasiosphaeria hispida TaxID=260671 RepID=A0AAJ0HUK9_9PEZI|nr:hypothetical protein B0T25DRAFT_442344 [Lasiosphaeria hispida]